MQMSRHFDFRVSTHDDLKSKIGQTFGEQALGRTH